MMLAFLERFDRHDLLVIMRLVVLGGFDNELLFGNYEVDTFGGDLIVYVIIANYEVGTF